MRSKGPLPEENIYNTICLPWTGSRHDKLKSWEAILTLQIVDLCYKDYLGLFFFVEQPFSNKFLIPLRPCNALDEILCIICILRKNCNVIVKGWWLLFGIARTFGTSIANVSGDKKLKYGIYETVSFRMLES